jgi:hypothetical protein
MSPSNYAFERTLAHEVPRGQRLRGAAQRAR